MKLQKKGQIAFILAFITLFSAAAQNTSGCKVVAMSPFENKPKIVQSMETINTSRI